MTKAFSFQVKYVEQRVILHYVRIQTNANKFYTMEFQEGEGKCPYRIYIAYGRTGSPPRKHERYFQSRSEAKQAFDQTLITKRKKGYELILVEEDWSESDNLSLEHSSSNTFIQCDPQSPTLSIDTPLGKLSEIQLHRGLGILAEIEQNIHYGGHDVMDLSNQFYSVIPVAFGSQVDKSYSLDTLEKVQAKKDWLNRMIHTTS